MIKYTKTEKALGLKIPINSLINITNESVKEATKGGVLVESTMAYFEDIIKIMKFVQGLDKKEDK